MSSEANRSAGDCCRRLSEANAVTELAMSDGGEGWLDAFRLSLGGEEVEVDCCDPLRRSLRASYLRIGTTAVIESARAAGLTLLREEERNPLLADTYGVGLLIAHAVELGCDRLLIGLGGSGTSDAGRGLVEALRDRGCLESAARCEVVVATDVSNPLCGERGAAQVFGPQKGADPAMVKVLDERAKLFAQANARRMGVDCSESAGAGAAGGMGYALIQFLHGRCVPGADLLFDTIGLDRRLESADVVITGEGASDRQTLMGKLPYRLLKRAKSKGVETWLLAGRLQDRDRLLEAGFDRVETINPEGMDMAVAMRKEVAKKNIQDTVQRLIESWEQ